MDERDMLASMVGMAMPPPLPIFTGEAAGASEIDRFSSTSVFNSVEGVVAANAGAAESATVASVREEISFLIERGGKK